MTRKPRTQITRRHLNDMAYGFNDPDGHFSWSKFVGVWGQITALFHFGRAFDELIKTPETMLILLAFIITPELIKMMFKLKYGGAK